MAVSVSALHLKCKALVWQVSTQSQRALALCPWMWASTMNESVTPAQGYWGQVSRNTCFFCIADPLNSVSVTANRTEGHQERVAAAFVELFHACVKTHAVFDCSLKFIRLKVNKVRLCTTSHSTANKKFYKINLETLIFHIRRQSSDKLGVN